MKRIFLALVAASVLSSPAFAAATKIGVSMDKFDDNFLTVLRNGMADYAKTLPGVTLQIEDAKDDVSKQLSQVQNFIANGVNAIIVNPVDTSATAAITKAAADAGMPLVYVNREPTDVDKLGPKAAFVASNEAESGTLETKQICKLLGGKGNILVIEGVLSNQSAVQRTKDVHEVIATPDCSGMKIIGKRILARVNVEIVKRSDQATGFVALPKRWIVERTFAWLGRCRRLAKDWECLNHKALAFLRLASIRLMLRKLCNPA